MTVIVWEFRVRTDRRAEFERHYGPEGSWAKLFREDPAYIGTELLRDAAEADRYLTIDRWRARGAFEAFKKAHAAEYAALDRDCEQLTTTETKFGVFDVSGV